MFRQGYQPTQGIGTTDNPPQGKGARNPHGTCSTCDWHSHDIIDKDYDGDMRHRWTCWRCSGAPDTRLITITDKQPPACECHLKARC